MAINIKHPEADGLAHALAALTGESLTEAVIVSLRERLARLQRAAGNPDLLTGVAEVQAFVRGLPDRDLRSPDALLGYDQFGLPG